MSVASYLLGIAAALLTLLVVVEMMRRRRLRERHAVWWLIAGILALIVGIFPSTLAYLFYNRGIELIGANRSAPFLHLIPVFGSAMAIGLLGEEPHLYHIVGYALVFAGVVIAARKPKQS